MQEAIAANGKIDKGRLNRWFQIDDSSLINVSRVSFVTGSLDVKFFQNSIFNDCNPAFLRLEDIDQHFFFHESANPDEGQTPESRFRRHKAICRKRSW
jgi:hypothetical protein